MTKIYVRLGARMRACSVACVLGSFYGNGDFFRYKVVYFAVNGVRDSGNNFAL